MTTTIRYATARCVLGHVLVAGGERGVGHLRFGDDPRRLVADFTALFPGALRAGPGHSVTLWTRALVDELTAADGCPEALPVPLDADGTAFQKRVWAALRRIPRGETRTYSAIARSLGQPMGARAVARACAANPVAVLVPCHRVVPKGSGDGEYRWGAGRKAALLARERRAGGARRRASRQGGDVARK